MHAFTDSQAVAIDAGKSEDEYYNFISVLPRFMAGETDIIRLLMPHTYRLDWTSIKDRGYRPMIISTEYLDYIMKGSQSCQIDLTGFTFHEMVAGSSPIMLTPIDKQICASTSDHEKEKFRNGKGLMARAILEDMFQRRDYAMQSSISALSQLGRGV